MINQLKNFDKICIETLNKKIELPNYKNISNIVICGMGGSGIVGDIAFDIFKDEIKIPIFISKSYSLPKFVNEKSLVICISYSGNTAETITQLKEAIKRKCKIIGITSDGKMLEILKKNNLPYIEVQKNLLPRAAIGYLLFSLINVLKSLKLIKIRKIKIPKVNFAKTKRIAKKLKDKIPIIISIYYSVAKRFKQQLNENSKIQARAEEIPELAHNEIESWKDLKKENCLVILRDKKEEIKEIKKSINFFKKVAKNKKIDVIEINAKGKTKIERILYLIWFCDLISYFLALERKVNPEETEIIKKFKKYVYSS